ncbi:transcriptional regulator [Clostridia bacterium]|nr:transcriptional regulator [Clostridia bacterium]
MFNLLKPLQIEHFSVQEAQSAKVGSFWKDIVLFYPYNRIYLVTDGNAELYLKNTALNLKPGRLYFIPAYSIVRGSCKDTFTHYFLHFQTDTLSETVLKAASFSKDLPAPDGAEALFKIIVENITDANKLPAAALAVNGAFTVLLSHFFRDFQFSGDVLRFADTLSFIDANLTQPISVEDLAARSGYNTVYFSNQFAKTFKVSPKTYIIQKRLDYACNLLIGFHSVKQAALLSGFTDEAYFSRLFKKKTGISPTEFCTLSAR